MASRSASSRATFSHACSRSTSAASFSLLLLSARSWIDCCNACTCFRCSIRFAWKLLSSACRSFSFSAFLVSSFSTSVRTAWTSLSSAVFRLFSFLLSLASSSLSCSESDSASPNMYRVSIAASLNRLVSSFEDCDGVRLRVVSNPFDTCSDGGLVSSAIEDASFCFSVRSGWEEIDPSVGPEAAWTDVLVVPTSSWIVPADLPSPVAFLPSLERATCASFVVETACTASFDVLLFTSLAFSFRGASLFVRCLAFVPSALRPSDLRFVFVVPSTRRGWYGTFAGRLVVSFFSSAARSVRSCPSFVGSDVSLPPLLGMESVATVSFVPSRLSTSSSKDLASSFVSFRGRGRSFVCVRWLRTTSASFVGFFSFPCLPSSSFVPSPPPARASTSLRVFPWTCCFPWWMGRARLFVSDG
mmetsp:Transcript_4756/g.30090  ORF Transcript_4756/g.30090 Transcript_4756/m.30090 type:complete len:415 (-) Transcript_4756:197-1441(-)